MALFTKRTHICSSEFVLAVVHCTPYGTVACIMGLGIVHSCTNRHRSWGLGVYYPPPNIFGQNEHSSCAHHPVIKCHPPKINLLPMPMHVP